MKQTSLWAAAGIIALVIVASFVLSVPHTRDVAQLSEVRVAAITSIPVVVVRDSYKKGLHTIGGSLQAPNACVTVSARASIASVASSTSQSILLTLTTANPAAVCLELPTPISFQTTLAAPANLPILVTVDGASATTTDS